MQQIAISGVGGQGVLFITKLLAETALDMDYSVMISETHGMAQRGGNVISHLKVEDRQEKSGGQSDPSGAQDFGLRLSSPLIRPGRADVLLALHPDGLSAHGFYLKPAGTSYCNTPYPESRTDLDASHIAAEMGSPISANLVFLGFAVGSGGFFCRPEQVEEVLKRYGGKRQSVNLKAFEAGVKEAERKG